MTKYTKPNSYSVFNILLFINICVISLTAQNSIPLDSLLQDVRFRNIGPAGMSGRVTAIDVDLKNPDRIYIGAASGGIWLSEDGGISWNPIFDKMNTQSIGALKIDPTNSDIIYAGSGEGNPRNSHTSGTGMYKSWDGGKTWKSIGLEQTKLIHRILINPQNPNIVYAGTLGSAWGPNKERGLYQSKDGGASWENILYVNDSTGIADLVMDPTNPNKIVAATWQFSRTPWTFNSGGDGSGMYITWDGGESWKEITSKEGLPKGPLGRIGVAIAPSKPNIVYALVEAKKNGLYKSIDGGAKWKLVSTKNIGNRPFYYAEFYVDPKNENRLFNLHTYMTMSEDGGKTFRNVLDYRTGVHPDHHAFWIHPDDPSFMIDGNDGGIAISRDGGAHWRHVDNLPIGQFYHVSIDQQIPYNVYGGMQDNGSWYGPSNVYKRGGIRNQDWREMYFGDGFDVVPVDNGARFIYAMSQGGNIGLVDKITGSSKYIQPIHPDSIRLRFNWNAAIAADPFDVNALYFGSQFVHYSQDKGLNWKIISPDLTTNDASKQRQHKSGGLTRDATAAENYTTILCIAPDILDENNLWVGTDDGHLQRSTDRGATWQELSSRLPGLPKGAWFPQIRHSTINKNELFVVANDYRRNNWSAYAYRSRDNGETWQRLINDQDVQGHCHTIIQDPVDEKLLFLGTEVGLYFSIDAGSSWEKWNFDFPSVPIRDMQISSTEHALVLGTFGRAFWILDDLTPLRFLTKNKYDTPKLIYDQAAYQANVKAADGIRFTADGEYQGKNRGTALFYYVFIPDEKKSSEKPNEINDKKTRKARKKIKDETNIEEIKEYKAKSKKSPKRISVVILELNGDTLFERKLKYKVGLNKYGWSLRRQSVANPSRTKRKNEKLPTRWRVKPDQYELKVAWGSFKDSMIVDVKEDPRLEPNETDYAAIRQYQQEWDKMTDRLGDATDLLCSYQEQLKVSESLIKNLPDTVKKEWTKRIKTTRGKIDSLFLPLLGPIKSKGIDAVTPRLMNKMRRTSSYINNANSNGNGNLDTSFRKIKKESNSWLNSVNEFSLKYWQPFVEEFTTLNLTPFKDENKIELILD